MTYTPIAEITVSQNAASDNGKAQVPGSSTSPSSFSPSSDTPSGMVDDSDMAVDSQPEIKPEENMMRYLMDEHDIQWESQAPDC